MIKSTNKSICNKTLFLHKGFFLEKLRTQFVGVADNPLPLKNTKNSILFYLCFAVGNKNGKNIALNIAQHILGTP